MKIVINPKYERWSDWLEKIPFFFEQEGVIIHQQRNCIKVFSPDEGKTKVNIKKFHTPHLFNRIMYTFFRKSKAYRSYFNTLQIAKKGFDTAEAIAYIEIHEGGLLSGSYFISLQCLSMKEMREYYYGPLTGNEPLIDSFTRYSASLHDAGIYHLDYSPGNILFHQEGEKYNFILVDVNRMKFIPVSFRRGCRNFARLFGSDEIYERIAVIYSQSRKKRENQQEGIRFILNDKKRFLRRKAWKKRCEGYFKSLSFIWFSHILAMVMNL
jgi:serine/threonine protein kinase